VHHRDLRRRRGPLRGRAGRRGLLRHGVLQRGGAL
jgi:hypothetical protein